MKIDDDDNALGDFLARHGNVGVEAAFADGTEIGEWHITGFIGRGGSSEVYCVRNGATGEPAALKILHRTEPQHIDRFDREVHFLESNASTHFPRCYGKGTFAGRPYVVMELLEPLPLPRGERAVASFLCSVADGVNALHARGLVHRDIKPANILWRADEPVIVDFGLLKEIAIEPLQSGDGPSVVDGKEVGVGTPRYAAPEQFAGGAATPATDIHALGRLAYECFEGRPPRVWSDIIRRATSSIPKERYQTAKDFIRAIQRRHRPRRMLAVLLGTALASGLIALWTPGTRRSESTSVGGVPPVRGEAETPQRTLVGADVATNIVQLALHHQILVTNEVTVGGTDRKQVVVRPQKFYQMVTNAVDATIINLNGATNRFAHPLTLDSRREYWVVGPGTLDAVFENSQGATIRLANCKLVNRSEESLKDAGIRYILYKGTQLEFPMISREYEGEKKFLSMSRVDFPNDDVAMTAGVGPDRARVKINYRMTEEEFAKKLRTEKALIRSLLKEKMRQNSKIRESDIDLITY